MKTNEDSKKKHQLGLGGNICSPFNIEIRNKKITQFCEYEHDIYMKKKLRSTKKKHICLIKKNIQKKTATWTGGNIFSPFNIEIRNKGK